MVLVLRMRMSLMPEDDRFIIQDRNMRYSTHACNERNLAIAFNLRYMLIDSISSSRESSFERPFLERDYIAEMCYTEMKCMLASILQPVDTELYSRHDWRM